MWQKYKGVSDCQDFHTFLKKKKIDAERFAKENPKEYERLCKEFTYLGEKAFYQRKLFLINQWRKHFPLLVD